MAVNENLKNLSGRQWQSLTRIIRKFEKGEISQEQAKLLLKSSLGLNDDEVNTMLAIDNEVQEFSSHEKDELLLAEFAKCGEPKNDYLIVKKNKFLFVENEFKFLSQVELDVMDLIRKDKRITPEIIADVLDLEVRAVLQILANLEKTGKIKSKERAIGPDKVVERILAVPIVRQIIEDQKEKIADVKELAPETSPKIPKLEPETLNFKILYSYEGPEDNRNRPFCARLMQMDKLWSRTEIESMSRRLGYSVFDRGGGWWTQPDGSRSKSCRHDWVSNVVMKKEK